MLLRRWRCLRPCLSWPRRSGKWRRWQNRLRVRQGNRRLRLGLADPVRFNKFADGHLRRHRLLLLLLLLLLLRWRDWCRRGLGAWRQRRRRGRDLDAKRRLCRLRLRWRRWRWLRGRTNCRRGKRRRWCRRKCNGLPRPRWGRGPRRRLWGKRRRRLCRRVHRPRLSWPRHCGHRLLCLCLSPRPLDLAPVAALPEIVTPMSAHSDLKDQTCVCQPLRAGVFAGSGDCCWLRRRRLGKRWRPHRLWGTRLLCRRAHRPRRSWPRRNVNRRRRRRCLGLGLANYPGVQKNAPRRLESESSKVFLSPASPLGAGGLDVSSSSCPQTSGEGFTPPRDSN